jgi:N-acetylated-alpha-linked acidic dipeptidase
MLSPSLRAAALAAAGATSIAAARQAPVVETLRWFAAEERPAQLSLERQLQETPSPASLRELHHRLSSVPHVAGTPGDRHVVDALVDAYAALGLDVRTHDLHLYLAYPERAELTIEAAPDEPELAMDLPLRERAVAGDPDSGDERLWWGWNAYSGSGDAVGEVVYANYGTKDDFARLAEQGVDVRGRIVIARYGGNFRGFKAKFAEAAGAAGLIIYTDPHDSGYRRGEPYPEGGWANETSIQRGSVMTLPYPGDPLTPFVEASRDAERLDPDAIALPRIPVQPVGWAAAAEIMRRMDGTPMPRDLRPRWQGGLPFAYKLTGGPALRVRLSVEQRREVRETANVLATLRGATRPEQTIVIGCHHDAWTFGAGDPNAGSIVVYEIARCLAEAARRGHRPDRTIVFANWAAEEYGIIGSTEWVEAHRDELLAGAVAYINLDMAAMGPRFGSSAAPLLRTLIADAARAVPQIGGESGTMVFDAWAGPDGDAPAFGSLGGGSDHVGFYCHVGVPCASFGAGGSDGVSYHSNYETLAWYRRVVGDDYAPAVMLTRIGAVVVSRLAGASVLPLDPRAYAGDLREHLAAIERRAEQTGASLDLAALRASVDRLERSAEAFVAALHGALESGSLGTEARERIDRSILALERQWLHEPGLAGRPWYRSLYAATDPDSGYGAWLLPALRHAVESADPAAVDRATRLYEQRTDRIADLLTSTGREIAAR